MWMIELYSALCGYFLPGLPITRFLGAPASAVGFFCTLSTSTTGGHYNNGDVFFGSLGIAVNELLDLSDEEAKSLLANEMIY
jgi:hypothetical protein